ncbi:MAG: MotA/TolQ/ExbB proton channel family protein [Gemmataceae bacterium]|nr:MotA/TolQ/ExbB proton channel family protein [Gemmataceae bacterium]
MLWDHSLIELFWLGGFAMWPLLGLSVLGAAIILDRCVALLSTAGSYRRLYRHVRAAAESGDLAQARRAARSRHPAAVVVADFLDHLDCDPALRRESAERVVSQQIAWLETRLGWLGLVATLAPMLGLLGTVTGLVTAFHTIEVQGGAVQAGDLAGGIWEALITTVAGLAVGIPCAAAYHLIDQRIAMIALEMEWMLGLLTELFANSSAVSKGT